MRRNRSLNQAGRPKNSVDVEGVIAKSTKTSSSIHVDRFDEPRRRISPSEITEPA